MENSRQTNSYTFSVYFFDDNIDSERFPSDSVERVVEVKIMATRSISANTMEAEYFSVVGGKLLYKVLGSKAFEETRSNPEEFNDSTEEEEELFDHEFELEADTIEALRTNGHTFETIVEEDGVFHI